MFTLGLVSPITCRSLAFLRKAYTKCAFTCVFMIFFFILFQSLDEVSKSDIGRKIKEGVEEAAKTAKQSAESVTKGGEKLGKTAAFKAISQVHLSHRSGT